MRTLLALALLATLSACAQPQAWRPVATPPPPAAVSVIDPESACVQELERMNVGFERLQEFATGEGCGVANPVRVSATAVPWNRPGTVTCQMARTIARFEADVIQPLAIEHFSRSVRRIHHAGTYDCRIRRNGRTQQAAGSGTSRGGRLSEHSHGRAIDITAFELDDGTMIDIKKDWRRGDPRARFLHQVARAACSAFNVALTPNHDRFHQDHLHLDIGPYTLCGY